MKTEIYRIDEDTTFIKRGNQEIEVVRVYEYNLLATRRDSVAGYRVQSTTGKSVKFLKLKADAVKFAIATLKNREQEEKR